MAVAYSQIHNNNNHSSCYVQRKIIGSPCDISSHVQIMIQILLKIK